MPRPSAAAAPRTRSSPGREARLARALLRWFDTAARELPWRPPGRAGRRDPYHTLVSEFMLQQTQASRIALRFPRFIDRFPSLLHLARADEHEVLAEWSGLGYYARARHLHAAARAVAARPDAALPTSPEDLAALPGIGRYTAGAIASLAFNTPAPAVDGNVSRVILRLEARPLPLSTPATLRFATDLAARLLATPPGRASAGALNEALIELGATVCTPRNPRCDQCPLARDCRARARGLQASIPAPRRAPTSKTLIADTILIRDGAGRMLLERRPRTGLWAALWQAPTLESILIDDPGGQLPARAADLARRLQLPGLKLPSRPALEFTHATTHRRVCFRVWPALRPGPGFVPGRSPATDQSREWKSPDELPRLALANPQRRILLGE